MWCDVSFFKSGRKPSAHDINTVNNLKLLAQGHMELSSNAKNTIRIRAKYAMDFYMLTCDPIRRTARAVFTPDNNGPQFADDNLRYMREYTTAIAVIGHILASFDPTKPIIKDSRIDHVLRQFAHYDWSLECAEPPTPLKTGGR